MATSLTEDTLTLDGRTYTQNQILRNTQTYTNVSTSGTGDVSYTIPALNIGELSRYSYERIASSSSSTSVTVRSPASGAYLVLYGIYYAVISVLLHINLSGGSLIRKDSVSVTGQTAGVIGYIFRIS